MICWCTLCYGGVLYVMVVYCVVGGCTLYYGGVLYVVAVYCVAWRCTVVMEVYCMLG